MDSDRRRPLHADLLPGVRHPQAHRQRPDPGQGLRDAGRDAESAADRDRQSVRRSVLHACSAASNSTAWARWSRSAAAFLGYVIINGAFKLYINTYKGRLGERMLRRLRYQLVDRVLRFPFPQYRRVRSSEIATMIKDEVDPLGGFIGEAFATPAFLVGQALAALLFIMLQSWALGLVTLAILMVQTLLIPKLQGPAAQARVAASADGPRPVGPRERDRRRRDRHPPQRQHQFRALGHFRPAGEDILHPLRLLPVEVHGEVHQQLPRPVHALRLLSRRRHTGDPRQSRHRPAGRRHRRLQGSARADQGTDRLGLPAPRRAGEVPAGRQRLRHHAAGAAARAGAAGGQGAASRRSVRLPPGLGDRRIRQDADQRSRPHDRPARERCRDRRGGRRRGGRRRTHRAPDLAVRRQPQRRLDLPVVAAGMADRPADRLCRPRAVLRARHGARRAAQRPAPRAVQAGARRSGHEPR